MARNAPHPDCDMDVFYSLRHKSRNDSRKDLLCHFAFYRIPLTKSIMYITFSAQIGAVCDCGHGRATGPNSTLSSVRWPAPGRHIVTAKGTPAERQARKATGLRDLIPRTAGLPVTHGSLANLRKTIRAVLAFRQSEQCVPLEAHGSGGMRKCTHVPA